MTAAALDAAERDRLRREHDALAETLAARRSVELARKAIYALAAAGLAAALTAKLAWDLTRSTHPSRFQGSPLWCVAGAGVAVAGAVLTARWFAAARRLARDEDARFARLQALRRTLELDP